MTMMRILNLAQRDNYSLDAMMLKHVEECGELAESVNHFQGRLAHKTMKEPIEGEVADNIICAIAVLRKAYPETPMNELLATLDFQLHKKLDKWEAVIQKRENGETQ